MKQALKDFNKIQFNWPHLISRLILVLFVLGLLDYLIIPIIYWGIFGGSAGADRLRENWLVEILIFLTPLLFLGSILIMRYKSNQRHYRLIKARSYIVIGILLLLIYPFKQYLLLQCLNLWFLIFD